MSASAHTQPDNIRVAIVGIGSMGQGLSYQASITPGLELVAIANRTVEKATQVAKWLERPYRVVESHAAMHDAVEKGLLAICQDGRLMAQCELLDVYIEATNSITAAAEHATTALQLGKHLVMMNAEADLIFGPYLLQVARKHGVVYSSCDGDQPASIARLINDLQLYGFELVMAGNIKGYLDRYMNPTAIKPEADKRNLDYKMCTSFTDGTKLGVEMALVANAHGVRTLTPGMRGPRAHRVHDVFDLFDFESLWEDRQPFVDYLLGAQPSGGVFAIGYTENAYQQNTLAWFPPDMGPGPYYLFYKPFHLGYVEGMRTVIDAARNNTSVLQPAHGFQTNVFAYAKSDLKAGELLDGVGGHTCYGLIENLADTSNASGLPICLANRVKIKHDIPKDTKIRMEDLAYDPTEMKFSLYQQALDALPHS